MGANGFVSVTSPKVVGAAGKGLTDEVPPRRLVSFLVPTLWLTELGTMTCQGMKHQGVEGASTPPAYAGTHPITGTVEKSPGKPMTIQ